jgi:hypothetical protein
MEARQHPDDIEPKSDQSPHEMQCINGRPRCENIGPIQSSNTSHSEAQKTRFRRFDNRSTLAAAACGPTPEAARFHLIGLNQFSSDVTTRVPALPHLALP